MQDQIAPGWYTRLLEYNSAHNVTTPAFVSANEMSKDLRQMSANVSHSRPEFRDPRISVHGYILPGPMIGRIVLGSALLTVENATYEVFREFVQPYNFSFVTNDSFSFLTPRWAPNITDSTGYAGVSLRSAAGPQAFLSNSLFYTESCPDIGWLGSKLSCRRCPKGTA